MGVYDVRKALNWPRTLIMRRKYRDVAPSLKNILELHYYRPAIVKFIGATYSNPHLLHDADIDDTSVVLDVGAFNGTWAQHVIDRYDPVVYAFEPNPRSFERLQDKAANNPKLKPLCYGLGGQDESVDFTLNGLGSSMCDERDEHSGVPRVKVDIAAVDKAWHELSLGQVQLMKINIEGAEFPLLEKMAEAQLLPQVDCFLIQFHEWHPGSHRRRKQIRQELEKTHRLEWDFEFIWEKWVRKTP